MKTAILIARILLGIIFIVFGLNGFLHFIPMGPMPEGPAAQYMGALAPTFYLKFIFAVQLAAGILLLAGRYVPLALALLGPVIVNILLFHISMFPQGIGPGLLAAILWFVLFYFERSAFAGIFRP